MKQTDSHVSRVSTARCGDYALASVRGAVRACVEALPGLQKLFERSHSVLLKPNLLSSRRGPEHHVNTHPAVVRAVAELLRGEFGCEVAIGDSCGSLVPAATARAITISGMDEVARVVGASVYNVDVQPRHRVPQPDAAIYKAVPLPANLDQFDLIVSLPKLKTHNLTCITCAVKNMLGLVPGAGKKAAHMLAPSRSEFATLLCDLYALVHPGAAIVDGIVGMEGRGPGNGDLRQVGMVAASLDGAALDSVCAQVMGMDPMRIPLLAQCEQRALGRVRPAAIEVLGEPPEAFNLPDFKKPPAYLKGTLLDAVPGWLSRGLLKVFCGVRAEIDQSRCRLCGECARNCPSGAIVQDSKTGRYRVLGWKCIGCFCCDEVCAFGAVRIERSPLRQAVRGTLRLLRPRKAST